jgi:hypothetical protein
MLPKPEKGKNKKLNNNFLSDSEVTQESEEVVNAKKIKSKRRLIFISLICTVGLSLIFWGIKAIQSFTTSPHPLNFHLNFNLKLPKFNLKSTTKSSTDISNVDLDKFLSQKNWSAIILKNNSLSAPLYQYNFSDSDINNLISDLNKIKPTEISNIASNLPQGLLFQEKLDNFIYGLVISLPNSQLIFIVKDNKQSANFTQNISEFIDQAYWYSVAQQ